ncbi:MAG TPA: DUF5320 domain-containing protein [Deltaproteobacteria bacterium]|nr:DUF5320 domain-containing protein [Deltaproteobacteria bacterium]HPR56052.1 DUF5320 domain-containing protein [Deltaproteobacteria bacterium]HXK47848.1 DUF5320 domain-containing protein [Deltaproteobacteria bacterium]
MPFGDRTGPGGYGPMTGRAAGFCAGYITPGYANPSPGRGFWGRGRGGGGGRGWRHWYYATGLPGWQRWGAPHPGWGVPWSHGIPAEPPAPVARQQELDALKRQAEYLEQTLSDIRKRLEEIQAKGTED